VTAEIDGLPAVTTRKTALVTQMTLLSAQRHRSLGKCGFRRGSRHGRVDCRQRRRAARVCHAVAALLQHTREAKELNRVNGMLINKQMGHAQSALQALRPQGQTPNSFYGPGGISTAVPRSRGFLAG
jgi:flagella synthesis protein FlgN